MPPTDNHRVWWVYDRTSAEQPGMLVRAVNRGHARMIGAADMMLRFTEVGCRRSPEHDELGDHELDRLNWEPEAWWEAI